VAERSVLYARYIVDHAWRVVLLAVVLTSLFAMGGRYLEFNANYRIFFSEGNPQLEAFDFVERVYATTDNIFFTLKPQTGDVYQPSVLRLVQELTEESWKLPYAQRVDSLTNFQHSSAEGDDLTVRDLVEDDPYGLSQQALDDIRRIAQNEPILNGKIVSRDGLTTGINILINLPRIKNEEVIIASQAARELLERYREKYPDIEMRPSGAVFLNNAFTESSMNDLSTLMPLMYLMLIVVMGLLVRSLFATMATCVVIMFSALVAVAFGGWMGFPLSPPSAGTPNIVLTLAIADSVHIIVSMVKAMQGGMAKRDAIVESLRINTQPVFLTSATTAIGFLTLNFSDSPPFWHLGNMTAFGIAAAFVYSMTLLPALLAILPINIRPRSREHVPLMERFAHGIVRHHRPLFAVSVLGVCFAALMVPRIELNDQFVQYFDEDISFRPDTEFMMEHLGGLYAVEYSVGSAGRDQITDPQYLDQLDAFTQWLRAQPEVTHVFSMSDTFKRLNKNMHGDDEEWYRIPQQQDMASQYLLLYEFSLPYGLDLTDRVNIDKSASRVTVTVHDLSTRELRAFKARSEQWLQDNTPSFMHAKATGSVVLFSFIGDRNIRAMLVGNIFALLLISGIILISLRSIQMGLASLLPNLMPVVLGFGLWALLVGQINMAAAFAFAVCLGIIVDDTVHFLSKYLRAQREKGLDARQAVVYAFNTVGTALVSTTIILVCGFLVLAQSGFQINSYLGFLASIVIASALVLDFFLLPPTLIIIDDIRKKFFARKELVS